eukprot:Skav205936  [mRNA]  locus=scaffold2739:213979:218317:- [translate_table: standard]
MMPSSHVAWLSIPHQVRWPLERQGAPVPPPALGKRSVKMGRCAASASAASPLPGPKAVPVLGAISVIWSLIRGKSLLQVLSEQRKKHGPLDLISIRHIGKFNPFPWVLWPMTRSS